MTVFLKLSKACLAATAAMMIPALPAQAVTITEGFAHTVAKTLDFQEFLHSHSSTGGSFGNPSGEAEVGVFVLSDLGLFTPPRSEEARGLSEYDLTGLSAMPSVFATFNVLQDRGIFGFGGENNLPFDGSILIEAFIGNNAEDLSDFDAPAIATAGSFSTIGLSTGQVLSFDITSIYNDAIANGLLSLGLRLRVNTDFAGLFNIDRGAWTFNAFRLTSDDLTTVSEPGPLALFGFGLATLGLVFRRRMG